MFKLSWPCTLIILCTYTGAIVHSGLNLTKSRTSFLCMVRNRLQWIIQVQMQIKLPFLKWTDIHLYNQPEFLLHELHMISCDISILFTCISIFNTCEQIIATFVFCYIWSICVPKSLNYVECKKHAGCNSRTALKGKRKECRRRN